MIIQSPNKIVLAESKKKDWISFIDMDGVLTNFLGAACKAAGEDINEPKLKKELLSGGKMENVVDEDKMWDSINSQECEFWSGLEILPWAKKLVKALEKEGEIYFLTSHGYCVWAGTGKFQWIEEHLGQEYIEKVIIGTQKHLCAAKDRILVDDSEKNIKQFREHGGSAFLWPRELLFDDNKLDPDELIKDLVDRIRSSKGRGHG